MILVEFRPPAPLVGVQRQLRCQRAGLWREAAWVAAMAQLRPAERPQRRSLVHVTLPKDPASKWHVSKDLSPTIGAIVDGLVHAGLWPDDTSEYVKVDEPSFWTASSVLVEISMIGQDA